MFFSRKNVPVLSSKLRTFCDSQKITKHDHLPSLASCSLLVLFVS